jgi:hypothetical protein
MWNPKPNLAAFTIGEYHDTVKNRKDFASCPHGEIRTARHSWFASLHITQRGNRRRQTFFNDDCAA